MGTSSGQCHLNIPILQHPDRLQIIVSGRWLEPGLTPCLSDRTSPSSSKLLKFSKFPFKSSLKPVSCKKVGSTWFHKIETDGGAHLRLETSGSRRVASWQCTKTKRFASVFGKHGQRTSSRRGAAALFSNEAGFKQPMENDQRNLPPPRGGQAGQGCRCPTACSKTWFGAETTPNACLLFYSAPKGAWPISHCPTHTRARQSSCPAAHVCLSPLFLSCCSS